MYSNKTHEATEIAISNIALIPKIIPEAIIAGTSEIITKSIIPCVEFLLLICGDGDTVKLCKIISPFY